MGCSASSLDEQLLSISTPVTTTSSQESTTNCCRMPQVLHPPPSGIGSPLLVDQNEQVVVDTWEMICDYEKEDEEEATQDEAFHKLLETYEILQWTPHRSSVQGSLLDLNVTPKTTPVADVNNSLYLKPLWSGQSDASAKVVLYITSLRGIRKTYDDCCTVKLILDGFRLVIDERDIAMDVECRIELQSLLGKTVAVPQLFIGGKHLGGADEVKQLHEVGELSKLLEGYPVRHSAVVCCICGGARFLLCTHCSGSSKVFNEEHGVLRRCSHCSENGLVKCSNCNT